VLFLRWIVNIRSWVCRCIGLHLNPIDQSCTLSVYVTLYPSCHLINVPGIYNTLELYLLNSNQIEPNRCTGFLTSGSRHPFPTNPFSRCARSDILGSSRRRSTFPLRTRRLLYTWTSFATSLPSAVRFLRSCSGRSQKKPRSMRSYINFLFSWSSQ
jgi:hypothetical protein